MNIVGKIRNTALTIAALAVSATSLFGGPADKPKITDTLNDFNPEYPIGIYIQEIASNEVATAVSLSNGVLTVGTKSINIAQPSHDVVETNVVEGAIVITTNTYYAVYEDGLANELKQYATNEKITSVVTNGTEVITNWTKVAYLSDIPPDEKKADKIMQTWEFNEPNLGVLLSRVSNTNAPFAYWKWEGEAGVYTSIDLFYKDGKWNVSQNGGAVVSEEGVFTNSVVSIDGFTFIATNREDVMVVYSDQLIDAVSGKLDKYVAKTNLVPIAEQITEERLQTINGIADTLRGIKQVVNDMTGLPSMSFTFTPPSQNFRCEIVAAETVVYGDSVEVDWGDGSPLEIVSIPTNHVYTSYPDAKLTVTIKGFVKGISGDGVNKPFIYIYSEGEMYSAETVRIDYSMPIEYFGNTAFYGSLLGDLSFINQSVTNFGVACFEGTKISSLVGMPSVITKIPDRCFANARNLTSLAGMSPSIAYIGEQAFNGSNIQTLNGFPASVTSLGEECFENCSSLTDVSGMAASAITEIPSGCFMGSGISSLVGLPSGITNIGYSAFAECDSLVSLEGIPTSLKTFAGYVFQGCDNLVSADFGNTALDSIPDYAFAGSSVTSIVLPSTVTTLSSLALDGLDGGTTSVTFMGKDIDAITNTANFAWSFRNSGAPPGSSVFIATDGRLVSDGSGGWTVNLTSTAFSLTGVPSGQHTVSLGDIEPTQSTRKMAKRSIKMDAVEIATGTYAVDWGDGTINTDDAHTYNLATSSDITIKVLGVLDSISGGPSRPFVVVDGNPTNNYLHSVDFGGAVGIKELGTGTFRNCKSLTADNIRGLNTSLLSLGEECFAGCNGITNLPWLSSTSVTALPMGCFRNSGMVSGDEGFGKIAALGDYSFYGCSDLVSVDFITNSTITAIPSGCFQNCAQLTSLPTLDGITQIGNDAFANCSKLVDFSFPKGLTIGDRAFYGCGTDPSVPEMSDEDGFKFKLKFDCGGMTYVETAQAFGLNDGDVTDTRTGIDPTITKFVCDDGELLFNNGEQIRRWEVVIPAIEFELRGVTNGTTFAVANTRAYDGASLIWNWGDGHTEKWITFAPPSHTYTNSAPRNYIVKVKGLLQSISSPSAEAGAYIHPTDTAENPFLVGFKMSDGTPLQAIGSHTFSRCPNLKNIDTLNLPRSRSAPMKPIKRDASNTRLENLSASMTRGVVTYGEGCFARSGIEDLSGLPSDMALLPRAIFSFNTNLASIAQLPKSLLDIEDESFMGDTSLLNLYGWPSSVGYVSPYCFAGCTELNSLYGIEGAPVTSIGEGAFYGCTNLLSLYGLPSSVETIGSSAFQNSGISSLSDMPSSVTNIEEGAFAQCYKLRTLDGLPSEITVLARQTFMDCTNLVDVSTLSTALKEIGDFCFLGNLGLTNFVMGVNVTKLGKSILVGCGGEAPIVLDEDGNPISCTIRFPHLSCSQIREFWSTNLVVTPPTTKLIGWDGYLINDSGTWIDKRDIIRFRISVHSGMEVYIGNVFPIQDKTFDIRWGDGTVDTNLTAGNTNHTYTIEGEVDLFLVGRISAIFSDNSPLAFLYSLTPRFRVNEIEIGNNCQISYLGDSCFRGMTKLTSLPDFYNSTVTQIGPSCFEGCTGITNLDGIPANIETIESNAFRHCSMLADIHGLSNTIVSVIGNGAFEDCTSLNSIEGLPGTVTNLPKRCFYGDEGLLSLDGITNTIETIENLAFANCTGLTNIDALTNTSLVTIGDFAFSNCTSLASASRFPDTLASFGEGCFFGCSSLALIDNIPMPMTALPRDCFAECTNLTSIMGLPTFAEIGEGCFRGCTSLESGEGYSVITNRIYNGTFNGCTSLKSLSFIQDNITEIGDDAFYGCLSLTDWVVPNQIERIGERAFGNCRNLTNIVFNTKSFYIEQDALVDLGIDSEPKVDETGNETKAFVYMKALSVDEIYNLENFPFGAPLDTTMFIGSDGYLMYGKKFTVALEADMQVTAGHTYFMDYYIVETNSYITVLWGDGTGTNMVTNGRLSHVYPEDGMYTLKIIGMLKSIEATTSSGFLTEYNGSQTVFRPTHVKAVRIPSTSKMRSLGSHAFVRSDGISSFTIEGGSAMEEIGELAFYDCKGLTEISLLSENTTNIAIYAFASCSNLESIQCASNSIIQIEEGGFRGTGIKTLSWLPSSIVSLDKDSFRDCSSLIRFDGGLVRDGLVTIGSGCFNGCSALGSSGEAVEWASNVLSMAASMFANTHGLCELIVPQDCVSIGQDAFTQMGSSIWPYHKDNIGRYQAVVNLIGKEANRVLRNEFGPFPFGARDKTRFICDDGIIAYNDSTGAWTIYPEAIRLTFTGISNGSSITINETYVPSGGDNLIWNFGDGSPSVTVTTYPYTHTYSESMPTCSVTCIGKVQKIGNGSNWIAIGGEGRLAEISITKASNLDQIGANAFKDSFDLGNAVLGSRLSIIGDGAFGNCTNLNSVTLPGWDVVIVGGYTIENEVFSNCCNLAEIKSTGYSLACKGVKNGAFAGCSSIENFGMIDLAWDSTNVVMGIGVSTPLKMYKEMYPYRAKLTTGYICEEVLPRLDIWNVPHDAVVETANGYIVYDDGWKSFETAVVVYERRYSYVHISGYLSTANGVLSGSIGKDWPCSVVIGKDVQFNKIQARLFDGTKLESITDNGNSLSQLTDIGDRAFAGCSNLRTFSINEFHNVTNIGNSAFAECSSLPIGTGAYTFPSCISFGEEAFRAANVTNIAWMNSSAVVKKGCFSYCPLTSLAGFPSNGDGLVPDECFMYSGLTSISNLPPTITEIGVKSFYGCPIQTMDYFGETNIRKIGDEAFRTVSGIPYIRFPSSIREMGKYVFESRTPVRYDVPTRELTKWNQYSVISWYGGDMMIPMKAADMYDVLVASSWSSGGKLYASNYDSYPSIKIYCQDRVIQKMPNGYQVPLYRICDIGETLESCFTIEGTSWPCNFTIQGVGADPVVSFGDAADYLMNTGGSRSVSTSTIFAIWNIDVSGDRPSNSTIVMSQDNNKAWVSKIVMPTPPVIGANTFSNLTKCKEVEFYTASTPIIHQDAFSGIGSAITTYQYMYKKPYKTLIKFTDIEETTLLSMEGFPFGAPTTTIFKVNNGMVYYNGTKWDGYIPSMTLDVHLPTLHQVGYIAPPYYAYTIGPIFFKDGKRGRYYKLADKSQDRTGIVPENGKIGISMNGYTGKILIYGEIERIEGLATIAPEATWFYPDEPTINNLDLRDLETLEYFSFSTGGGIVAPAPDKINWMPNMKEIGVFCNDDRVKDLLWLPVGLETIDDGCFSGCRNLSSLKGIGRCTKLKKIGEKAFEGCIALVGDDLTEQKTIDAIIPHSVTNIGKYAFCNLQRGGQPPPRLSLEEVLRAWWAGEYETIVRYRSYLENRTKLFLCFKGRTCSEIMEMENFPWDYPLSNYTLDGDTGRIVYYGTDGWIEVQLQNGQNVYKMTRGTTGL